MNIIFKSINIDKFMSIEKERIILSDLGITLVKGINNYDSLFKSNGSGKSAIFDAILWCLTGTTSRGSTRVANRIINSGVSVELSFSIDNNDYVVTRSENGGKSLTIIKNGEDISGSTYTKSKEILKSQLSFINYEVLTSIVILSQGLPGRLSSLKPVDRKARLEYLSNTDELLAQINTELSKTHTKISGDLSELNTEKSNHNTSISSNNSIIESCNTKITDILKSKESINTDMDEKSCLEQIDSYREKLKDIQSKYNEAIQHESSVTNRKNNTKKEINNIVIDICNLHDELKSVESNICPLCKSVLTDASELKDHIIKEIDSKKNQYQALNDELIKLNQENTNKSLEYSNEINDINSEINKLIKLSNDLSKSNSSIESYESTKEECSKIISDLQVKLEELEPKIKSLTDDDYMYNFYKSATSRKFRTFLLEGVIDYLNKKLEYYSKYLFSNQVVHLESNSNNIDIKLGDSFFEDLSGGEGRRVDIALQLAQRDLSRVESGFNCNILILDEILDNLDSDGISNVLSMLEKESEYIESLLIVTHQDTLELPNDSTITIVKNIDGISHISKN